MNNVFSGRCQWCGETVEAGAGRRIRERQKAEAAHADPS
jgi:hypothetical protein